MFCRDCGVELALGTNWGLEQVVKDHDICQLCHVAAEEAQELQAEVELAEDTKRKEKRQCRTYKIAPGWYDLQLGMQNGGCAICGTTTFGNKMRLAVDHNHETDKVRGLLCTKCNSGLGFFQDDPELLERAARYLREYEECPLLPNSQALPRQPSELAVSQTG